MIKMDKLTWKLNETLAKHMGWTNVLFAELECHEQKALLKPKNEYVWKSPKGSLHNRPINYFSSFDKIMLVCRSLEETESKAIDLFISLLQDAEKVREKPVIDIDKTSIEHLTALKLYFKLEE